MGSMEMVMVPRRTPGTVPRMRARRSPLRLLQATNNCCHEDVRPWSFGIGGAVVQRPQYDFILRVAGERLEHSFEAAGPVAVGGRVESDWHGGSWGGALIGVGEGGVDRGAGGAGGFYGRGGAVFS